jgi:hypothetical protein
MYQADDFVVVILPQFKLCNFITQTIIMTCVNSPIGEKQESSNKISKINFDWAQIGSLISVKHSKLNTKQL